MQVAFLLCKLKIDQSVRERIAPVVLSYFGRTTSPKIYADDPKEELPFAFRTDEGLGSDNLYNPSSPLIKVIKKNVYKEEGASPYMKERELSKSSSKNEAFLTPKKEGNMKQFKKKRENNALTLHRSEYSTPPKGDTFFGIDTSPLKRVASLLQKEILKVDGESSIGITEGGIGSSTGSATPCRRLRSDSVAHFSLYSKSCVEDLVCGLLSVCITTRSKSFFLFLDGFNIFSELFFTPAFPLRARYVEILFRGLKISESMREHIETFKVLSDVRHYTSEALNLLHVSANAPNPNLQCKLVTIALQLEDYRDLNGRLEMISASLAVKQTEKTSLLKLIWSVLKDMKGSYLKGVNLEDIHRCVNSATASMALLSTAQKSEKKYLMSLFTHHLESCPPQLWRELFKSANRIAIFIKDLYREDIGRASAMYRLKNTDNDEFRRYLPDISRILRKPIATDLELREVMKECFAHKVGKLNRAAFKLLNSLKKGNENCLDLDEKMIVEMSIVWMGLLTARIGLPMPPRNTQLITLICCILFGKSAVSDLSQGMKVAVAQVGSGDDRNLVVAMAAAYYCKRMQKSVHILMSNTTVLDKDYEEFKYFFKEMNITCSRRMSDSSIEEAAVTYCLRSDIEEVYRADVYSGRHPLDNCVLVVTDMDDLMIHTSQKYSTSFKGATHWGMHFGDYVKSIKKGESAPEGCLGYNQRVWKIAESAVEEAEKKINGVDYTIKDGIVSLIDTSMKVEEEYNSWLECIKSDVIPDYNPILMTDIYCHSLPHTVRQYDVIIGFSGATLGNVETEFLSETYGAWTFSAPLFQYAYNGTAQPVVKLISDIRVLSNKKSQEFSVISKALQLMKQGPILIITENDEKYSIELCERLKVHFSTLNIDTNLVTVVADGGPLMGPMMYTTSRGEEATEIKIHVTNRFGERALDYGESYENDNANNDDNDNKGMSVIMMVFPKSVREWIEWKERTIRSHRNGQYIIILNAENDDVNLSEELLISRRLKHGQPASSEHSQLQGRRHGQGHGQVEEKKDEDIGEQGHEKVEEEINPDPNADHRYSATLIDDILLIRDRYRESYKYSTDITA